jgi:ABC-type nickel/cobalt efflux system permease component RcnA
MHFKKQSNRKFWSLLAFLMVLSVGIWSCTGGNAGEQTEGEQIEATTEEASTDEHPADSEHPTEHPAADTTAQDSTKQSEHPSGGSEHPNN